MEKVADVETPITKVRSRTNTDSHDSHGHSFATKDWGPTPDLRKTWTMKRNIDDILAETKDGLLKDSPTSSAVKRSTSYKSCEVEGAEAAAVQVDKSLAMVVKDTALAALAGFPGLVIAVLMNLFFGVSFGQAFFPTSWEFPPEVPRAIGVQVCIIKS